MVEKAAVVSVRRAMSAAANEIETAACQIEA